MTSDVIGISKEVLLDGIHPAMKLDKAFFLQIYGYEVSYPGFSNQAIQALEAAGCSRARTYYDEITGQCQRERDEIMRSVAAWYVDGCNREWNSKMKAGEEQRKQQKERLLKRKRVLLTLKSQQLTQN